MADEKQTAVASAAQGGRTIRIQYYRSAIGFPEKQKRIVKSAGLTKLNQVIERPDTPAVRGLVSKVPHLLRIVE